MHANIHCLYFQSGRAVLEDLFTDLRDGSHLLSLLEVLSGLSLVSTRVPHVVQLLYLYHLYGLSCTPITIMWQFSSHPSSGVSRYSVLAHLSRRLTRWAYNIAMVCCPSSVVRTVKLKYLCGQVANLNQILCEAPMGWGKDCIRFWRRLDQNPGFHGNQNLP